MNEKQVRELIRESLRKMLEENDFSELNPIGGVLYDTDEEAEALLDELKIRDKSRILN